MHSISSRAEGGNSMEIVSVKILLKQAYSAHLGKVRSLEHELRELREKLQQMNKSDKTECVQCKEMQKALDSCKEEHAAALQEQKTKIECLAQKLASLENRNMSSGVSGNTSVKLDAAKRSPKLQSHNENTSAKQDAIKKSHKLQSEPSRRKQVLMSVSTNISLPKGSHAGEKCELSKVAKSDNKSTYPVEVGTRLFGATGALLCSDGSLKDKTSTSSVNQKDFVPNLNDSFFDNSNDDFDVVLVAESLDPFGEVPNKNCDKKKHGEKKSSPPKVSSSKICANEDFEKENIFDGARLPSPVRRSSSKRSSAGSSNEDEQVIKKCKSVSTKETLTTSDIMFRDLNLSILNSSVAKAGDSNTCCSRGVPGSVSNLENLSDFNVDTSFFEVEPSILEEKSPSILSCNKKSKTSVPSIEVSHDDNADFKTVIGSISKSGGSGEWKTSKKNPKKSAPVKNIKSTSRFKMTLEAPRLNFRKPKFKQTKLSQSIFQPSHTSASTDVQPLENVNINKAENDESNNKSRFQEGKDCEGTQKEVGDVNETLSWDGGTLSNSEMEKLKNMTIDMDATFVPDLMHQNSNDSVLDIPGMSNVTKDLVGQKADVAKTCDKGENDENRQNVLRGETSRLRSNQQRNTYHVEQYPQKNGPKLSLSTKGKQKKYNSFDKVPSPEKPTYKFKEDPVRKKNKRQQLKGFDCKECEKYYSALGLTDEEKKVRMKQCSRHRATYAPPGTPEHFWDLDFPDTQECKERGYLGDTQKVPLKSCRRRPLT